MTWSVKFIKDWRGISELCVWCSETEKVVLTGAQMEMLSKEFVQELCNKHNEAYYQYGRWWSKQIKEQIKECYKWD